MSFVRVRLMNVIAISMMNAGVGRMYSLPTHRLMNESPSMYMLKQMMDAIHMRVMVSSQKKDLIFFLSFSATRFPTPAPILFSKAFISSVTPETISM